jgi:hypothetical protein
MSSDPTLTISTPNPVILNDDINITGTIDAADVGDPIGIYDGQTLLKTVTAGSNGTWSTTLALPEATTYSLTAQATNATGTGTSAAIALDAFTFSQADLSFATSTRPRLPLSRRSRRPGQRRFLRRRPMSSTRPPHPTRSTRAARTSSLATAGRRSI